MGKSHGVKQVTVKFRVDSETAQEFRQFVKNMRENERSWSHNEIGEALMQPWMCMIAEMLTMYESGTMMLAEGEYEGADGPAIVKLLEMYKEHAFEVLDAVFESMDECGTQESVDNLIDEVMGG